MNNKEIKILIAAGGTGGHLYPALAIIEQLLKNKGVKILFVGTKGGIEEAVVKKAGIPFESISAKKLLRRNVLTYPAFFFSAVAACFQSLSIVNKFRPDVCVGVGGYVSGPVALAGWFLRVPVFIHEQNTVAGLTNRILGKAATGIGITFEVSGKYFPKEKIEVTGNPVREEVLSAERETSMKKLGLDLNKKTVLVFGGSRGARKINTVFAEALKLLDKPDLQILHITGRDDFESVKSLTSGFKPSAMSYELYAYMDDIWDALAAADLVVCRAGATSIAEITTRGLPSILIPYPYAAENHQMLNAEVLMGRGASRTIADSDLNGRRLACEILSLINNLEILEKMGRASKNFGRPCAAARIAAIILQMAQQVTSNK